jgi:hypothetical protein
MVLNVSDPNYDPLTFHWTSAPNYGTASNVVRSRGTYYYYYTPTVSPFRRRDVFTYTVTDSGGLSTDCTAVVRPVR